MAVTNGNGTNGNGTIGRIADAVEEIADWGERFGKGGGRPPAQPPTCFSELARLNQCYDDIQQMKIILTKVMTDLIKNDPDITQSILDAIQQSGTSTPILGVTDGSAAQPGQVGELVFYDLSGSWSGAVPNIQASNTMISVGPLPPGDWDVSFYMNVPDLIEGAACFFNPMPQGSKGSNTVWMLGYPAMVGATGDLQGVILNSNPMAVISDQVQPLVLGLIVWASVAPAPTSGTYRIFVTCRRRR
jgi:hypothetical protein